MNLTQQDRRKTSLYIKEYLNISQAGIVFQIVSVLFLAKYTH